jgi:hypothetical protein
MLIRRVTEICVALVIIGAFAPVIKELGAGNGFLDLLLNILAKLL